MVERAWSSGGSGSLVAPLLQLDEFVDQVFLVQDRRTVLPAPLPRGDVGELVVVTQRLAVLGLGLGAEGTTAGLAAVPRVDAHELTEREEVGDAPGLLEALVERVGRAEHLDVAPELVAQATDEVDGLTEAFLGPLHAAVLPHDVAELLVEGVD